MLGALKFPTISSLNYLNKNMSRISSLIENIDTEVPYNIMTKKIDI